MGSAERITSTTNYKPIGRKSRINPSWSRRSCPEGCAIPLCRPLRIFQFLTTLLLFSLVVYLTLKSGGTSSESADTAKEEEEKEKIEILRAAKSGKHLTHLASILLITLTSSYLFFMAIDIISQFGYHGLPDTPMFLCSFLGMLLFGIAGVLMVYYRDPNDYLTELILSQVLCFIISALFLIEITMLLAWWRLKCLSWKKCYPYTPGDQRRVNTIFNRDCPCDIITEGNKYDTATSTSNVKIPLVTDEDCAVDHHGCRKVHVAHRREYIDRPSSVPALSTVQMAEIQTDPNRHCVTECQTHRTEFKESIMQTNSRCELCNRLMDTAHPSMQYLPQTASPCKLTQQGHCAMCPAFFHMMRGPMASPCCQSCNCGETMKEQQPRKPVPYLLNETPQQEPEKEPENYQETEHQRPRTTTISAATGNNSPPPETESPEKSDSELRGSSTSKRAVKNSSPGSPPESGLATITSGLPETENRVTLSSLNHRRHKRTQTRGETEESESSDHGKDQADKQSVTFASNNETIHDVKSKLMNDVELRKKLSQDPRISYVSPTKSALEGQSTSETLYPPIINDVDDETGNNSPPRPKSTGKILYRAERSDLRVSEPADPRLSWLRDKTSINEATKSDWNIDKSRRDSPQRTDDEIQSLVKDEASTPLESELSAIEEESSDLEGSSVKKKASSTFSNKNKQDTNISNTPVLRLRSEESGQDFHDSDQWIQESEDAVSRFGPKNRLAPKRVLGKTDWTTRERSGIIEEDLSDQNEDFPVEDEETREFSERDYENSEPRELRDTGAKFSTPPSLILRSKTAGEEIGSGPVLRLRSGNDGDDSEASQRRIDESDYVSSSPSLKSRSTKGFLDERDSDVPSKSQTLNYELSDGSSIGRMKRGNGSSITRLPTTKASDFFEQRSGKIESDRIDSHLDFPDEDGRFSKSEDERQTFSDREKKEKSGEYLESLKRQNEFDDVTSSSSLEGMDTLKGPSTEDVRIISSGSTIQKGDGSDTSIGKQKSAHSSRNIRSPTTKASDFFDERSGKIERDRTDSYLDYPDEEERFSKSEDERQELSDREKSGEYLESLKRQNETKPSDFFEDRSGKIERDRTDSYLDYPEEEDRFSKSEDERQEFSDREEREKSGEYSESLERQNETKPSDFFEERSGKIERDRTDSYLDYPEEEERFSKSEDERQEFSDREEREKSGEYSEGLKRQNETKASDFFEEQSGNIERDRTDSYLDYLDEEERLSKSEYERQEFSAREAREKSGEYSEVLKRQNEIKPSDFFEERSIKIERDRTESYLDYGDEEERFSKSEDETQEFSDREKRESSEYLQSLKRQQEFADVTSSSSLEDKATLKGPSTEAVPFISSGSTIRNGDISDTSSRKQRSDHSSRDIRSPTSKALFPERFRTVDDELSYSDENFPGEDKSDREIQLRTSKTSDQLSDRSRSIERNLSDPREDFSGEDKSSRGIPTQTSKTRDQFSDRSRSFDRNLSEPHQDFSGEDRSSREVESRTSKTSDKLSDRSGSIDRNLSDPHQDFAGEDKSSREVESPTSKTSDEISERSENINRDLSNSYQYFGVQDKSSQEIQSRPSKASGLFAEQLENIDRNLTDSHQAFSGKDKSSRRIQSRTTKISGEFSERSVNIDRNFSDSDKGFAGQDKIPSEEGTSATSSPYAERSEDESSLKTDEELAEAIIQEGSGADPEEIASPSRKSRITPSRSRDLEISADLDQRDSRISSIFKTRDSEMSSEFKPRDSRMSSEFEPRDSRISSEFEPRDSRISSEFESRDSRISSEFEPRDSRISSEFKPKDTEIASELKPRESRISSEFEPRDSRISSEFEPRDSRISSEFEPRDSRISSEFEPRDSRISSEFKPKDTEIPSEFKPRESRISSEFKPRDSEILSDSKPRYSRISSAFKTRDTRISSESEPRDSKVSSEFKPRDLKMSSEFEPRDSRISSEFEPRDSRISSEFEPRDSRISSEFKPKDTEIPSDLKPRDSRISSEFEPRDSRISSEFEPRDSKISSISSHHLASKPRDSRISSEFEPRDSIISSELKQRDSRISSEFEPRDSRISSEFEPRDSRISSEFEPRKSRISSDLKPRDSRISSAYKTRDSRISSELKPRDSRILSEFEPRDSRISTEFKPRESEISPEFKTRDSIISLASKPRDSRISSEFEPRDSRISSEFEPRDSRISSEFEPRDSRISSEFEPRDSRISSEFKPRDSRISSEFKPRDSKISPEFKTRDSRISLASKSRDSRISSEFEPRDSRISSEFKPRDSRISSEFKPRDSRISSGFEPRDSAISSGFKTRDSRISSESEPKDLRTSSEFKQRDTRIPSEFEPRDSRISSEFKPRDSIISSEFKPRHSRTSSEFKPRDSRISSEFKRRDSRISSEFEPRDSAISSEFKPRDSRISSEFKPRDSRISSELKPRDSRISSEFEPRDSAISSEFKPRDSRISSEFKSRDSRISSKFKPSQGEVEQSRFSKFKTITPHVIGQIGRDTSQPFSDMSDRERKLSERGTSSRSSEFLSKSVKRRSEEIHHDDAEPYVEEWSAAESEESAPPRLSSTKPRIHKDDYSRTATIYEYEEDDETSEKDSTPFLDSTGEQTNISEQEISPRSEESKIQDEDGSITRFEDDNNEQMEYSDVSESGKRISTRTKSRIPSEINAEHSNGSEIRKSSDTVMTRNNDTSKASLKKRSREGSEFVRSSQKIGGDIDKSYTEFPGEQRKLSDRRPLKRLSEFNEAPEEAEQVESQAKIGNLDVSESKVFSPSRQLSRTKPKMDQRVDHMKDSIEEELDQSRRATEEEPIDRNLETLKKWSRSTSTESPGEFIYVPAPWSSDGSVLQRKSRIESVDQRRKTSVDEPATDSHDVPPNGSPPTQCVTNEGCPTFEMRVGGVTSICTDDTACAEPCSCRIKSILLDQCSEHPPRDSVRLSTRKLYPTGQDSPRDSVRLSSREMYPTGQDFPRNSQLSRTLPWDYRRNETIQDSCFSKSRGTCKNNSQPKRLILDHFCHVS